jgi:hypothetical protein
MSIFTFDVAAFRAAYPQFEDVTVYPDARLQGYWNTSICFISDEDYGWLNGNCRLTSLNLLTAHIAALASLLTAGQVPSLEQSATVDKVSVSLTPPPVQDQFRWWLNLTGYGQQLLVLLEMVSVGGWYIGGSLDRAAFKKFGGFC